MLFCRKKQDYDRDHDVGDNDDDVIVIIRDVSSQNTATVFLKPALSSVSRSTLQVGPEDGPQEAASVQRLSDHGEGRELAEEEPHPGALQRDGLLRRGRQCLH